MPEIALFWPFPGKVKNQAALAYTSDKSGPKCQDPGQWPGQDQQDPGPGSQDPRVRPARIRVLDARIRAIQGLQEALDPALGTLQGLPGWPSQASLDLVAIQQLPRIGQGRSGLPGEIDRGYGNTTGDVVLEDNITRPSLGSLSPGTGSWTLLVAACVAGSCGRWHASVPRVHGTLGTPFTSVPVQALTQYWPGPPATPSRSRSEPQAALPSRNT